MALQPTLRSLVIGSYAAPHTLDVFGDGIAIEIGCHLDYVCPFSAKIAKAIDAVLKPLVSSGGKYADKVKIIIRSQIQPWHPSSTLTHEAAIAVAKASPSAFWPFALLLFAHQEEYYDIPTLQMTPLEVRQKLVGLASQVLDSSKLEQVKQLLANQTHHPNAGIGITDDLKYNIRFARQNGIHVSPSALWDGVLIPDLSSSWGQTEWESFLEKKVTE